MAVNVPVRDLRSQPHTEPQRGIQDPLQETQLLYGERVHIIKQEGDWVNVEAVEQPEWTHARRWRGYPGWLPLSALSPWKDRMAPTIVVTRKWVRTWRDSAQHTPAPWSFAMGTRLHGFADGQRWQITLLDGTTVWMARADARSLAQLRGLPTSQQRDAILRSAEQFLGDPYF